ncbi:MAG: STAS domain-containing protein [Pseudomonadales bacterium]|nr:STAS domain-containing protein [Pseudomonadales bacterium]
MTSKNTALLQQISPQKMTLEGVLNQYTVAALRIRYASLIEGADSQFSMDLSGVSRSTSVGLSLLLCYMRKAKKCNKALVFVSMPDALFEMARVSGLDDVLPQGRG